MWVRPTVAYISWMCHEVRFGISIRMSIPEKIFLSYIYQIDSLKCTLISASVPHCGLHYSSFPDESRDDVMKRAEIWTDQHQVGVYFIQFWPQLGS